MKFRLAVPALLAALLMFGVGCGDDYDGELNSVADLENQLERQLRRMDLDRRPDEVHILQFRPAAGGFNAQISFQWNRRTSSNTEVHFVSLSGNYAAGTITLTEFGRPVSVLLHFPD